MSRVPPTFTSRQVLSVKSACRDELLVEDELFDDELFDEGGGAPQGVGAPPMFTVPAPVIIWPTPPQCLVSSPMRTARLPLMKTVAEPLLALYVLGPQHAAWMPLSQQRNAGIFSILTSDDPLIAGPTAGCGQPGQPCASAGQNARSPTRQAAGMITPPEWSIEFPDPKFGRIGEKLPTRQTFHHNNHTAQRSSAATGILSGFVEPRGGGASPSDSRGSLVWPAPSRLGASPGSGAAEARPCCAVAHAVLTLDRPVGPQQHSRAVELPPSLLRAV